MYNQNCQDIFSYGFFAAHKCSDFHSPKNSYVPREHLTKPLKIPKSPRTWLSDILLYTISARSLFCIDIPKFLAFEQSVMNIKSYQHRILTYTDDSHFSCFLLGKVKHQQNTIFWQTL